MCTVDIGMFTVSKYALQFSPPFQLNVLHFVVESVSIVIGSNGPNYFFVKHGEFRVYVLYPQQSLKH